MRDYGELVKALQLCPNTCRGCPRLNTSEPFTECKAKLNRDAADAIEELLSVCREIAAFVMHYSDEGEVSAEVLCRKLHKIGLIEKDGAWWTLPAPPKGVK